MSERLVRMLTEVLHRHRVAGMVRRSRTRPRVRIAHALVRVRRLLGRHATPGAVSVVGRAAGAAARAQQPEQTRPDREGDGDPGHHVDATPHASMDAVLLERRVEGARQHGEERRRRHGCRDGEQKRDLQLISTTVLCIRQRQTYPRHQTGDQAAQTAADGRQTHDQLHDRRDEGHGVGDEHPLGHALVRVEPLLQIVRQQVLDVRVVQLPHLDRVEPELGLARRAVGDLVVAVRRLVPRAVVPQADVVEVVQIQVLLRLLQGVGELLVRPARGLVGEVDELAGDGSIGRAGQVGEIGLHDRQY